MIPLCRLHTLPYQADPAVYFSRVHREAGAVLLDSGRPVADRGRYDILSAWPLTSFSPEVEEDGLAFFRRLRVSLRDLGQAQFEDGVQLPFAGGLLGYLPYEFGERLEAPSRITNPDVGGEHEGAVDARLGLYDWALITDHQLGTSQLVFHPSCAASKQQHVAAMFSNDSQAASGSDFQLSRGFRPSIDRRIYQQAITRIQDYIRAGDCYQVNYTQRFHAEYRGDPWVAYCLLRQACATPFAGFVNLGGDNAILSLSPERFMRLQQGRIEARPIKGTRPRGNTPEADRANAEDLCRSVKDRAENVMIVDLLRNDIGRSSKIGTVHVPELCSLESYPNVHHLVSCVQGELAEGLDVFDLLATSFPGGSITGAPKIRAMEIINELEPTPRSVYCGSLLYIDVRGAMDSSIMIRTLLAQNGHIHCWGGGGIVADSQWESEYQESLDKVGVLLKTLQQMMP